MNYFNYILSDRKAMKYWIFYYSILIVIMVGALLANDLKLRFANSSFFDIAIIAIVFSPFIIFYSASYFNYRNQLTFLRKYSGRIKKDSIQKVPVELEMTSSFWRVFMTSNFAHITPKPRHDNFTVIQIDNNIGILGQVYDLGLLRRHFKPIIIPTTDILRKIRYSNSTNPDKAEISRETDDMTIKFHNMPYGIKRLKLIKWYHINANN